MGGSALRNLDMFEKICGKTAFQNVILATTMWSEVDELTGSLREEELKTKYWKAMIIAQAQVTRFQYTHDSAWEIISRFTGTPLAVQLQDEMINQRLELKQTTAGSTLFQFQDKLIGHLREMIRKLEIRLRVISKHNEPEVAAAADQERLAVGRKLDQLVEQKQKLAAQLAKTMHSSIPNVSNQESSPAASLVQSKSLSSPWVRVSSLSRTGPYDSPQSSFSSPRLHSPSLPSLHSLSPPSLYSLVPIFKNRSIAQSHPQHDAYTSPNTIRPPTPYPLGSGPAELSTVQISMNPVNDKKLQKEAEKLRKEAEKQRRVLAERRQREQARAVMRKRDHMIAKTTDSDNWEWSSVTDNSPFPVI
jgi:hypothetical protein